MSLWKVKRSLLARKGPSPSTYRLPRVWTGGLDGIEEVDPYDFFLATIDGILASPPISRERRPGWSRNAHVYNLFIRAACAFDHDGDGSIGCVDGSAGINREGVRETGTFLKALALLGHIRRLGCDTVYLLPVTAIGHASRKGLLGSPYAIRNPLALDENLADPLLPDLGVEDQFAAFTEAAHRMGLAVVLEFVFRTASQDSDWVQEHPDWFYWIDGKIPDRSPEHPDGYGNPPFTEEEMRRIRLAAEDPQSGLVRTPAQVAEALAAGRGELVEPPQAYRDMFRGAPESVEMGEGHRWYGRTADGSRLRIPGAFADWPPDDVQPPWTDVTYLRMYGKPGEDFDYMAYNTIRLYDPRLATPDRANRALWDRIASIVPHYQRNFGINGVMIDMGHALPVDLASEIQRRARELDESFAFWEEKFFLDPNSPRTGYEAVVGPGIFTLGSPDEARRYLAGFQGHRPETRFFATGENHNTPRMAARPGGSEWTRAAWALALFLPGSLAFVHNGIEVLEKSPLNTGLGFSREDLEALEGKPLGLFDAVAFSWESDGRTMIPFMSSTLAARRRHLDLVTDTAPESYGFIEGTDPSVLAYRRRNDSGEELVVTANTDSEPKEIDLKGDWECLLTGRKFRDCVEIGAKGIYILERTVL